MITLSSFLWFLFFFGIGSWFFYYNVIRHIPDLFYLKKLKKRIYHPNIKSLDEEIKTYSDMIDVHTNKDTIPIFQKTMYIKLIAKDIAVLNTLLKKQKSFNEKNIIARTLALQLFEFYNDINNLYDKKFEKEKIISEDMVGLLKDLKKINAIYKTKYFEKLKEIRFNIVAHRDFDTGKQNTLIQNLDYKEILEISKAVQFMIYFFNAFHIRFIASAFLKAKLPIPNIPMFDNHSKDFYFLSRHIK